MKSKKQKKNYEFEVAFESSIPIVAVNIPIDPTLRLRMYKALECEGVKLPDYDSIKRSNLKKRDLVVVLKTWNIIFEYNYQRYSLTLLPGAVIDYASVPTGISIRSLTKRGQHIDHPSAVHDALFALNLLPFEDSNNIFEGMIDHVGLTPRFARFKYMLGVRSFVGRRIYEKSGKTKHWLEGYVLFRKCGKVA